MSKLQTTCLVISVTMVIACGKDTSTNSGSAAQGGSSQAKSGGAGQTTGTGGTSTGGGGAKGGNTTGGAASGGTSSMAGSTTGGTTSTAGNTTGGTTSTAGNTTGGTTGTAGSTTGGTTGTAGSTTGGTTGTAGSTTGGTTGTAGAPSSSELIGWATQGTGTTGGGDLTPVVVTSLAQLNTEAGGETAKVIHVKGTISGAVNVGSNKTIIGLTGAEISNKGPVLRLTGSKNVIIKNLKITGAHSEINTIFHNSTNIWFDHNAVTNGKSDLLRVTGSSNYVTLSWNIFKQTAFGAEHMGVNIGLNDQDESSKGVLNVTLHHNVYQDLVNERMPRARFGKIHTFNNVCYAGTKDGTRAYYAVRAGFDANVRSERNVYKDFVGPSWWWTNEKLGAETTTVFNYARGSANSVLESIEDVCLPSCVKGPIAIKEHEGVTGEAGFYSKGTAFVPPYPYVADPTDGLEAKVMAGAGPK